MNLIGRGQTLKLAQPDQEKVFERLTYLLDKISDEEEDIEYIEESVLHNNSILNH